jgi:PAS domain S-box-containing protein
VSVDRPICTDESVGVTTAVPNPPASRPAAPRPRPAQAGDRDDDFMHMLVAAVEQSQDVILITEAAPVDLPGPRITYVNPAFERMTGYAASDIIGKSPRILQGPASDREALDRIRLALKNWTPIREEIINYRKDGTQFWVDFSIVPVANESGWYTHWVSIQRDTTDQHTLRSSLHESRERLRVLTESIPQLLWTASSSGACQFVSQSCADFIGVTAQECLGEGWSRFIHPDDVANTFAKWQDSVQQGLEFIVEYRLKRYDNEYLWFLHRAVPRRGENGNVIEWVGTSTEIEFKKRSENALRQTEKLAAVGRLASSIAHEINNPLNSVMNLLFLLGGNPSLNRSAREYVKSAQDELARISEITTQALRFHRQSLAPAPTRISEVLDSILSLNMPRILANSLKLERTYEKTDPLTCRAGDLRQALSNIIANAIDATPRGGKLRIRLRTSRGGPARRHLGIRITIADSGCGIHRDQRTRIFEPFFTTKGDTGTGLGLWIASDVVARHGGRISLWSSTRPGKSGTAFSIFLPFEPELNL